MNDEARKMLDEILTKEPAALTDADKEFLRARRSYLSEEQLAVFAGVLGLLESAPQAPVAEEPSVESPAPRRGRKPSVE